MEAFYLLFILLYVLLLWSMERRWLQKGAPVSDLVYKGKVALLVPFRNEAEHLPGLLTHLERLHYPLAQLIFIDDDSSDDSAGMVSDFIRERNLSSWVLLKSRGIGKKAALTTGVHFAQADIILTTDADCMLPPDWVQRMVQAFTQPEIELVAGSVITGSASGFFARFQQIEWASILLLTKYLFSTNRPLMCSGANLAYRKSAFLTVEGYSGNDMYPSGDDEFLLKKIVGRFGKQAVTYLHEREVLVETRSLASWSAFIQQRIRWAGKWRLHRSWSHALSAALAFGLAVVQLASLILLFGSREQALVFLVFWAIKTGVERRVLGEVLAVYHIQPSFHQYLASSFLHPIYVVLVGIRAIRGKYTWKGRRSNFID